MILLTVFFLLISLDFAEQSWAVGMRQFGVLIGICAVAGFGGLLLTTSPWLFVPLIGLLVFASLAKYQMWKYGIDH